MVVFSDLDDTLLEADSLRDVGPLVRQLRSDGIPLVLCTGKTFAEVKPYRIRMRNAHPFVVENGGAIYVPKGYFPFPVDYHDDVGRYHVIRLGADYGEMVRALAKLADSTGVRLRGFSDMKAEEVAAISSLTPEQAVRAKRRDHDEPFVILEPAKARLVEQSGPIPVTRGRRFHHLNTSNKGVAAAILIDLYRKVDDDLLTVGLGDSVNDLPMLECVDVPILVRQEDGGYDPQVVLPGLRRVPDIGPAGLTRELMSLLAERRRRR
jgi:mannosyl-3-phosphoglycerate phosphatase